MLQIHISVIVPTCNRPDDLRRCLAGLSAVNYPNWDIWVVDQSDDVATRDLVAEFQASMPQLNYQRLGEKGLSRARNAGLALSNGEIVAYLDDDCTVSVDWLDTINAAFTRHAQAAVIFGVVVAAPHDWTKEVVPTSAVETERVLKGRSAILRLAGMGASMYLRRQYLTSELIFDTCLGPGAPFATYDDLDFAYRALAAGHLVIHTPSITILHYGARTIEDGAASRMLRHVARANGAMNMKLLRSGDMTASLLIPADAWRYVKRIRLARLLTGQRPSNIAWTLYYIQGLFESFRFAVDAPRLLYVAPRQ